MRLYLLRHGIAEEWRPGLSDQDRQLTEEGIAKMRAEAKTLARLDLKLDLVLSSPLPRARQTAEIVMRALELQDRFRIEERLAHGFGFGDLQEIVSENPEAVRLMLVGHEPGFSTVAGQLAGGAAIDLKKGGLICLETDRIEPGRGLLRMLVPPSVLTA